MLGHRGVRASAVRENSIAAFRQALAAGLDGIECDVQQTRDGELVLYHDEHMAGSTVTAETFANLSAQQPNLARLSDLLDLAGEYPGTLLNLELKLYRRHDSGMVSRLAREVRSHGLADRVLISSFDPFALLRLRLAAPELRAGLLYSPGLPALLRSGALAGWLHVDAIHPHHLQVDETLMRWAEGRSLKVNTWTVNDPEEVARLVTLGVSGIIGDDPKALVLGARAALEASGG